MKELCCREARIDLGMLVCMSHNMNGASTASARKVGLQDSLYEEGNSSYAGAVDSNIGFASDDSSLLGSSALCVNSRMLVPNIMAPLHRGDVQQNLVSMSHIFSSFRASQSMSPMSPVPPGSSHVCRVCSKAFRASSLLDIHMRVHVGAKPFVCPMCGHRATQKGNLKLHMKKHHGAELPPHIDLVPDSGIWGHPQENILCSTSTQQYDGFDNNLDASGKRKQVAQAVSSLLNEEVVELIKKYQNDAGQGTTGTITESLEDFIRIAKNKSCADTSRMSTEEIGMPKKAREAKMNRKKKHLALSLRFQPYPKYPISPNSASTFAVTRRAEIPEHGTKCIICEKSLPSSGGKGEKVGVQKLHICEVCLITQGYASLIPSLRVLSGKSARSDEKVCFSNETGPATINNVSSEELEKKTSDERPSTCDSCGSILLDSASLKRHKKQCHAPRRDSSSVSSKEKFLFGLGLVPKTSVTLKDTNMDVDVKQAIGLNPVLDHVMLFASKAQSTVEIPVNVPQYPVFAYSEVGPTCTNQKRSDICYKVERKRESHSPVRRRASPGVLNMLRKTLLNSADQRQMARREVMPKSEDIISSLPKDITEPALFGEPSKTCEYRNPAMRSLADIGKSMIKNTRESEYFPKIPVDGPSKTIVLDHHEHENNGYKCPYCPKWFKYRSVLEIHVRSHTGERPYKCPYCEYAGTQHNCLKLHIQRHHPAKYAYNRAESVGAHHMGSISQTLTTESVKGSCFSPVNCPVCGRVSPSPGYLKIHMRSHKKSLDHVCHVCGRGFKEYWYLSTHLKTHERELNSLKLNIQQYNLLRSGGVESPSSDRFNSHAILSKFPATPARHEDFSMSETSVTPRILKHEPTSTKHIFASASDIHHAWKREVETFPVSDFTIKTANSEHMTDVGSSATRSRRRKASCPSRVVSAPYSVPKSPIWKSVTPSQKFTETYRMENVRYATQNMNSENIEGDLPLDLRCPAKKLSDKNNNDVPMNLCKT